MSEYTLIILVQSVLIFIWVTIVKRKNSNAPKFNTWFVRKIKSEPAVHFKDAFEDYITRYEILSNGQDAGPDSAAIARLKLIEEYNIDDILEGDDGYESYKKHLIETAYY